MMEKARGLQPPGLEFVTMPTVKFVNENKQVEVPEGTVLRKAAIMAGVNVHQGINGFGASANKYMNCHGFGMCATCGVNIVKGMENASSMGAWEKCRLKFVPDHACLHYMGNEETMRLSCRTTVQGDMEVQTAPEFNMFGENFFS